MLELDPETCYRAVRARDRRFDGRFFTGVVTTGIYCRPICPARTPKAENVRYYATAAAAEAAGFRACKRCRPECAPGSPPWSGTAATVGRALRMIDDGEPHGGLADRLGIGERHLRRLFVQHVGAPPRSVAMTRRTHFARRLLEDTALSVGAVAEAAGFASARAFAEACRARFGAPPSKLRRRPGAVAMTIRLAYRPPLAWDSLLAFLAPRAIPGVERVEGDTYLRIADDGGAIAVRPGAARGILDVELHGVPVSALMGVCGKLRRLLDLDADPAAIAARLAALRPRPGLRLPGAYDPWEVAARAIVGQQVSVAAATTLMGRLAALGEPAATELPGLSRRFPAAAEVARADLSRLGLPRARAEALRTMARAVASGDIIFDAPMSGEDLRRMPGIGPWTASVLAMRAFGEPDAFPAGDLVLRRVSGLDARALERASEAWRPYRAYAALHLWEVARARRHA